MIEMKVSGLALDEETQAPVLVLKSIDEKTTLPIWIGAMEAMAISLTLNDVKLPRPMTHDLLLSSIEALGGKVLRISVTGLTDGTFFAIISVDQGGKEVEIDARPSDAVALALRAKAPILVAPAVVEALAENKPKPGIATDGTDDWTDILESYNPADTKYKM
ncbi:bifunctional nuclease family protein [Fundidesulfovibrio soli]|uniref:bifunctional nuclease family protein n=1 Tax=Fundidesulfovibrio soli TaxID=2922716 RepID=UPI001FAF0D3D|nr:bifunctional nuclease family protein [Fundidesulfovibrio soli]